MTADEERADFKKSLTDIMIKCQRRTMDLGHLKKHCVTMCIPECTPMGAAARFFHSMVQMYRDSHFPEECALLFDPDSIGIEYDGVYQCLKVGIIIYEG